MGCCTSCCTSSTSPPPIEMDHYTSFHSSHHPPPPPTNDCDLRYQAVEGDPATFGCGDFHEAAAKFALIPGVIRIRVGYSGGKLKLKYPIKLMEDHTEVVDIEFDPFQVKYEGLLEVFWGTHDPTINHEPLFVVGPPDRRLMEHHLHHKVKDEGKKRLHSKILYHSKDQKYLADEALMLHDRAIHSKNLITMKRIRTDINPARHVFSANKEDQQFYLQQDDYLSKLVNCSTSDELQYSHLACKLNKLCSEWATLRDLEGARDELQLSLEVYEHLKRKICERV